MGVLFVCEGEHGAQVAEHEFLLGVCPHGLQDLLVHLHLVLLALVGHGVLLQMEQFRFIK